ncbi:hypothetical protein GGF32_002705 [Allomyces javanicus]|nr:hypothetical protein GGF32_002705 [Allomyces javanicus]
MSLNKLITVDQVETILNLVQPIGDDNTRLRIRTLEPYQTAFVHKSYYMSPLKDSLQYFPRESNERLEFLGDRFLGAAVSCYLVQRYPNEQEGFLTKILSRLVRSSTLAHMARFLGLGEYILLCPEVEASTATFPNKGRNSQRIYEDVFESFCGAIIEDFGDELGYRFAKRFVVGLLENQVDFAQVIMHNENYKDTLQQHFQKVRWNNPVYPDLDQSGPKQLRVFTKGVFITQDQFAVLSPGVQYTVLAYHSSTVRSSSAAVRKAIEDTAGYIIGIGQGNRKLDAEQMAARHGILNMRIQATESAPASGP